MGIFGFLLEGVFWIVIIGVISVIVWVYFRPLHHHTDQHQTAVKERSVSSGEDVRVNRPDGLHVPIGNAGQVYIHCVTPTAAPLGPNAVAAIFDWGPREDRERLQTAERERMRLEKQLEKDRREKEELKEQNSAYERSMKRLSINAEEEKMKTHREYSGILRQSSAENDSLKRQLSQEQDRRQQDLKQQEARTKAERQKVMVFTLALESRVDNLAKHLRKEKLYELSDQLYDQFHIRLLGFTCGLKFLLKAEAADWSEVMAKILTIETCLKSALPAECRAEVKGEGRVEGRVTRLSCDHDVDLRLGQPFPEVSPMQQSLPEELARNGNHPAGPSLPKPKPQPESKRRPKPKPKPEPEPEPEPVPMPKAEPKSKTKPKQKDVPQPKPKPESLPMPKPKPRTQTIESLKPEPKQVLSIPLETKSNRHQPGIICILMDSSAEHVFMADNNSSCLRTLSFSSPQDIASVPLETKPRAMALVKSGSLLVVTSQDNPVLCLFHVQDGRVREREKVKTSKCYWGVSAYGEDHLVVSCSQYDQQGPPSVDIIDLNGQVVRELVSSKEQDALRGILYLADLRQPHYVFVHEGEVLIADRHKECVYRVDIDTRQLKATLTHPRLRAPCQVCTDREGQVFVASHQDGSILVWSRDGQWLQVVRASGGDTSHPLCVCVQDNTLLVSWGQFGHDSVVLKSYRFQN